MLSLNDQRISWDSLVGLWLAFNWSAWRRCRAEDADQTDIDNMTIHPISPITLWSLWNSFSKTPLVQTLCSMSIVGVRCFLHRAINVSSWLLGLDLNKKFIRTILHSICIILLYTYALYCVYLFVGAFLCSFCVIRCCDNHFLGIIKSTVCLWCLWCCVEYYTNFVYLVLKKYTNSEKLYFNRIKCILYKVHRGNISHLWIHLRRHCSIYKHYTIHWI